jgi:uncharacterized FlaG/YvyC family protein
LNKVDHTAPAAAAVQAPEQAASNRQIVQAVKAVNKSEMLGENSELSFMLDRETQRPVIQILDRRTREVIQQIPPEYVLRLAADLEG